MIREILSLSRVGTQAVNRMNVGAGEVVQAAIDNLAAAIEESSARITIDPLPTIYADPGLLSLVFQNLIGNAIKFRGEKRPEIHIEGNSRGRECVISIRDNGIGMQPEHLSRIFLMFERLHSNEEYPGTGVGLAVAKKVVERHNGRLWAQSKPGEGSIFFISLPNPDLSWQNFREM
jgi:light-regulated signal transduction histidine kinase (bacteriophytochrome)